MRAAGGLQEHKDPALVDNQLPMDAPPWGSYLEGLGHKRPFQPPTSSESVNQCTNTNVISHPAGTSGRAHLVSYLQKNIWPLRLCSSWGLLPNQHSNFHPLRNARNLLLSTPADKSKQHVAKMWPQTDTIQAILDHRQLKVLMSRCVCGVWALPQVLSFSQDMTWSVRNVNGFSGSSKSCGVTGGSHYTMA